MSGMFEISGRCHCGNIHYKFLCPVDKTELPIRSCDCSFCVRQGATYTSHPQGKLQVQIKDADAIQWYRFGSETAEVLFCAICGVFPLISCEIDDHLYAVLNANSINGLHIDPRKLSVVHQESLGLEEMLQKRQENWIGDVVIQADAVPRGINPSFF